MRIALIGANRAAVVFIRALFARLDSFNIQILVIPTELFGVQDVNISGDFEQEFRIFKDLLWENSFFKQIEFANKNLSIEELSNFDEIVFCAIAWSDWIDIPTPIKQCKQIVDLDSITDIQSLSNCLGGSARVIIQSGTEQSIELGMSLAFKGHKVVLYNQPGQPILANSDLDSKFLNLLYSYLGDQGIEFESDLDKISDFDLGIWSLRRGSFSLILQQLYLDYDQGIKLHPSLQSLGNDHIWALGTAGQIDGVVLGNASSLQYQASQIVNGLLGKPNKDKIPIGLRISYNSLEALAFGSFKQDLDIFYYLDSCMYSYKAIQVENGRVVAGIFLGVDKQVLYLVELWQSSSYLFNDDPMFAISPSPNPTPVTSPRNMPSSTLVCQCNLVTKSDIVAAAQELDSFEQLQQVTKVSMGCGGCSSLASSIFEWVLTTQGAKLADSVK